MANLLRVLRIRKPMPALSWTNSPGTALRPSALPALPSHPLAKAFRDALPFLCSLTITVGFAFDGLNSAAGQGVLAILSGGMLLALLLSERPGEEFWRERAPVLIPALLAFAWLAAGGLGISLLETPLPLPLAPDYALASLLAWLGGFAALLSGSIVSLKRGQANEVVECLALLIGATLLIGLVLHFQAESPGHARFWAVSRQGRFAGLIGNVNVTAAIACAVTILALVTSANRLQRGTRGKDLAVALAGFAVASVGLLATLLTAARFPFLVGIVLSILTPILIARKRRRGWRKAFRFGLGFAVAACAMGLAYSELLLTRFEAIDSELQVRSLMWRHYLALSSESPLHGYGPGSFPSLNAVRLDDPVLGSTLWYVNSAHNIVLQLALEGGLPYLLLMGWAGFRIAQEAVPLIWWGRMSLALIGVFVAILQLLACSLVDITLDVPATIFFAMFLTGMLWGRALRVRGQRPASARTAYMPGKG